MAVTTSRINSIFAAFGIDPAAHAARNNETVQAMLTRMASQHTQDSLVESLLRAYPANGTQFVTNLFTDRGLDIAQSGETADQRVARIVTELRGGRTFTDLQASLDRLSGTVSPPSGSEPAGTPAPGTVPTPNPADPIVADVRAVFDRYGVTYGQHADGTLEDPNTRINRLVADIKAGRLTLADLNVSVANIAAIQKEGFPYPSQGIQKNLVPGDPQIWKNTDTGQSYLVYDFLDSGVPMMYEIDDTDLQAVFGPKGEVDIVYDMQANTKQINSKGALVFGGFADLSNQTDDPARAFMDQIEAQSAVRPWLREDDVLQLVAEALLEGREVSSAEFQQTNWWQSHNEAQRQWLLIAEADPSEATRIRNANQSIVKQRLQDAGVNNASDELITKISNEFTMGNWDQAYLENQIKAVSDPYSGLEIDALLTSTTGGLDTTRGREQDVKDKAAKWLGPVYGEWDQSQINEWAGKIRNDPDAELELTEMLRAQRLAMFPQYANPQLTYQDIAQPWRNFWNQQWGQVAPETDPLFQQVISMNDAGEAAKLLRGEGLTRGIGTVKNNLLSNLSESIGSTVRRSF